MLYFVMFHLVMQLPPWVKNDACDDDRPPGFELLEKELVDPAQPSSIASLVLVEGKSSKQISPSYEDMRCLVEYVETELQLSAKNAMTEYVGSFLDSEVRKLVNSSKGENLMKVIWRIDFSPLLFLFCNIKLIVDN